MLNRLGLFLRDRKVTLLVALLLAITWLFIASRPMDPDWHEAFLRSVHELQEVDAALKRDLLLVRDGFQPHYDFLNKHLQRLRAVAARLDALRQTAERELVAIEPTLEALRASLQVAEASLEQFKSSHAMLRNSLAFVAAELPRLARRENRDVPGLGPELADFSLAVLQLMQDPDPKRTDALRHRLDHLRSLRDPLDDARTLGTIIAHGDVIVRSLPATQTAALRILELPVAYFGSGLRNTYLNSYTDLENARFYYQAALYALAVLVLLYLAGIHVRLQRKTTALAAANDALAAQVAARRQAQATLHTVVESTASLTGGDFFRTLVRQLSEALDVRWAVVSTVEWSSTPTARTLAFWDRENQWLDNLRYALPGTPCGRVSGKRVCVYRRGVSRFFPEDRILQDMGIDAYVGVPLVDDAEQVVGILAIMDDKAVENVELTRSLLKVFAGRAATELHRMHAERALVEERERALVTLHSITDAVITTGPDGRIDYINPAAVGLIGRASADAAGQPLAEVMQVVDGATRKPLPDPSRACLESGAQSLGDNVVLLSHTGREYAIEGSVAPIYSQEADVVGTVVVFSDVTDARRMAQRIAHQANHDPLTGLLNRRAFESRLEAVVARTQAEGGEHVLCYVDLDQFKVVNDTCGHAAGDQMLKQISGLLRHSLREADILGRLGGDEFGIVLLDCPLARGRQIVAAMLGALNDWRFNWEGHSFETGASIGVVPVTADAGSVGELMSRADVACYAAKDSGRNRLHIHLHEDAELSRRHEELAMVARINKALQEDRLRLYAQPIQPLCADHSGGRRYEVLVRLVDEAGHEIAPGRFIPAAERYNLMGSVDRWVIRHTFEFMAQQTAAGNDGLHLSINLSGLSLADEELGPFILEQLDRYGIRADCVCFEITETAAIGNLNAATRFMADMKATGCCFALDDFGSGLSSFGYLKNLPVDYLKIDGSFVRDIVDNDIDRAMVAAITQLAHIIGIQAIAEFVENDAILAHLRQVGVDYGQGYGLGRPVPLSALADGNLCTPAASGQ